MKKRMDMLGITKEELAKKSLVDMDIIEALINKSIDWKDLHIVDRHFLCHVLICDNAYFENKEIRKNDILEKFNDKYTISKNIDVNIAAAKIQRLAKDYIYLKELNDK